MNENARPEQLEISPAGGEVGLSTRRRFLLCGLGALGTVALAGCGGSQRTARGMPGPSWDARPIPAPGQSPLPPGPAPTPGLATGVISRQHWASGAPVPSMMDRMSQIRYITVHHDAMTPLYETDSRATASRLEAIRRGHRAQNWGDIGYHYAIDRAGNVWEARPIQWQGAHVGRQFNPGNVGIVTLGNFELQQPSDAQLEGLRRHVISLMRSYRVPLRNVKTHQEWAPTLCPGRNLQRYMVGARSNGTIA